MVATAKSAHKCLQWHKYFSSRQPAYFVMQERSALCMFPVSSCQILKDRHSRVEILGGTSRYNGEEYTQWIREQFDINGFILAVLSTMAFAMLVQMST